MKRTKYSYIGSVRPTEGLFPGFHFYDTTISKDCIWNGSSWDIVGKDDSTYMVNLSEFNISNKDLDHKSPYSEEEYLIAHNNKIGIQNALNYASEQGYSKVVFPKGTYILCYEEENETVNIYYNYKPTGIILPSNMDIDLNGSTFKVIFDSLNANPYDKSIHDENNPVYKLPGQIFEFNNTCNSIIRNGELKGDIYERAFSDEIQDILKSEKGCEQTYGILFKNQSYFNEIRNMNIHGFMGDAAATQLGFRIQEVLGNWTKGYVNNDSTVSGEAKYSGVYYSPKVALTKFVNGYISTTGGGSTRIPELRDKTMELIWYNGETELMRENYIFKDNKEIPVGATHCRFQIFGVNSTETSLTSPTIYLSNMSHHLLIEGCDIHDNHRGGLSNLPDFSIIRNNDIHYNGMGTKSGFPEFPNATRYQINFEDYPAAEIIIEGNRIRDGFHGILVSGVSAKIKGNTFENLAYGNIYYFLYDGIISDNIFNNCEYIFDLGNSDTVGYKNIKFTDNIINGQGYILLRKEDDKSNIEISNNTIIGYKCYADLVEPLGKIRFFNNRITHKNGRKDKYRLVKQNLDCEQAFNNTFEFEDVLENGDYLLGNNPRRISDFNNFINTSGKESPLFLNYNINKVNIEDFNVRINFQGSDLDNGTFVIKNSKFKDCKITHHDYKQNSGELNLTFENCEFDYSVQNFSMLDLIGYPSYNEGVSKVKNVTFKNCTINFAGNNPVIQIQNGAATITKIDIINCEITNEGNTVDLVKKVNDTGTATISVYQSVLTGINE